jgi:hypothetical protein
MRSGWEPRSESTMRAYQWRVFSQQMKMATEDAHGCLERSVRRDWLSSRTVNSSLTPMKLTGRSAHWARCSIRLFQAEDLDKLRMSREYRGGLCPSEGLKSSARPMNLFGINLFQAKPGMSRRSMNLFGLSALKAELLVSSKPLQQGFELPPSTYADIDVRLVTGTDDGAFHAS